MDKQLSFISLGGIGSVTRNMYVYEYGNEILLVDCGLGFADETMLGVDFLLPDITYLLKAVKEGKKIVGMLITHGHEDHMGALPFILPQLPEFPIYASAFTAALANEKLAQFNLPKVIQQYPFRKEIVIGNFIGKFLYVTHSIPDTAHIVIKTPVGIFYHGSDFKFDLTPFDKKQTDFQGIGAIGAEGVRCLLSECLGSEREGYTLSEASLQTPFEDEMRNCRGKFIVTTYSSNISRINQIASIARKLHRKVGFVGRSLMKAVGVAREQNLLMVKKEEEISIENLRQFKDSDLVLFVAGSQGQENSSLTRIINGEHKNVQLHGDDVIVFSADPIPGNEMSIYALVDNLSKMGIRVLYSDISNHKFHVSGHGSSQELLQLMALLKPQNLLPISGTFRQMAAYKRLAKRYGYHERDILVPLSGQQVIFTKDSTYFGQKLPIKHVYVDEVSGEEIEQFVLRDRQKISQEGVVAVIIEVDEESGSFAGKPEVVAKGFAMKDAQNIELLIPQVLERVFSNPKPVTDWQYLRKQVREAVEKKLFAEFKRRPLVLPVIIEI